MFQQRESREQLKLGLMSLPVPKNDFEIVLPENAEKELEEAEVDESFVEDAAEIELRKQVCWLNAVICKHTEVHKAVAQDPEGAVFSVCLFLVLFILRDISTGRERCWEGEGAASETHGSSERFTKTFRGEDFHTCWSVPTGLL